ncbi:ATP-binding protein [Treponema sp. C6A8]|uniref:hybrid sensor histidine kinase/response regulator n=1 Tax=Treponema sp. C6A8 TaxID=1410609 RepID=UPI000483B75F|nr:ATP-binding protein [Treponema sp. C6A8]
MKNRKVFANLISLISGFFLFSMPVFAQHSSKIGGGYAATGQIENVGFTCEIYDATNGLPTSDANFVLGAKNGYVWVCGYSGVFRYNGSTFERLPTYFGLTSGRGLFEDSRGRVWVATNDNGVVVLYDGKSRHYTYRDGLPSSSIRIFAEDNDENVFIGTTAGVSYINKNGQLYTIYDERINKERVLKLSSDYSGRIYGQTKNGLVFAIDDCLVTEAYSSEELEMEKITSLMNDPLNPGKVYLCTQGSTIYYGEFGKKASQMKKIDVSPLSNIHWISFDCGRIWVSSTSKVGYLDEANKFFEVLDIPMNSAIEMTTSDYQGNIWICSATQGVMKLVTNNFVNLSCASGLEKETTNSVCLYDSKIFAGTDNGLRLIDSKNRSLTNKLTDYVGGARIRCIFEDSRKNLWLATYTNQKGIICYSPDGKISSFTTKNGMPNNQVRCLSESKSGEILAGTNSGLVVIKDGKVIRTVGSEDGIKNTEFLTVCEGFDGNIYAGSDGDGIYVIGKSSVKRIGRDEGLTSDVIMRIKKDEAHGVLWIITSNSIQFIKGGIIKNIATFPYNNNYDLYINDKDECWILSSYGIFIVNVEELLSDSVNEYRHYTIANGLPSAITSNSYSAQAEDGTLFIAGREGVIRVNINHYFDRDSQIKVDLNSVYCDDKKIFEHQDGVYVLPASKGRIKLTPSVMDYTMTNPLVRVFLEGTGENGITVHRNQLTTLEYTSLSYGNYTFHIQILDNNRKDILLDRSFKLFKRARITELFIFRLLFICVLLVFGGFIVWRVMKSTVITRQYDEIRQAKDEAERANTAKSRFLSNMSKDILGPINTIMSMNEMIMREESKNVPKSYFLSIINYAFDIKTSSESLLTLVNDLLEMTKIETGSLHIVQQEYDVKTFLKAIVSLIRVRAIDKGIKFDVIVDEMIPKRLYGDVGKIRQVVMKLLLNAVRFTDEGGVELKLTMESRTNDICGLCFSVKDTGIGIEQEAVESLFGSYDADEKNQNQHHMAGLGLNISRKFAELMGGVLVCQSSPGEGSEFIFSLEQKIADSTPIGNFSEDEKTTARGLYLPQFIAPDADVLVVEDNPMTLHVIRNLLKATKVFVTTAESCEDCLAKIKNTSFNVVFVNYEMSGMDGEEIIDKIRSVSASLPVYALTENTSYGEEYYKEKGFTGYVTIPFTFDILERTIMRHLPEAMMAQPSKNETVEMLTEMPEELSWIYKVEEISVQDGIVNSGGIGSYIFSLKLFYDTIDDTANGINHSYQIGDFARFAVKIRILKNSARIIGAISLMELAAKFADACQKKDKIFIAANIDKLLEVYTGYKQKLSRLAQSSGAEKTASGSEGKGDQ